MYSKQYDNLTTILVFLRVRAHSERRRNTEDDCIGKILLFRALVFKHGSFAILFTTYFHRIRYVNKFLVKTINLVLTMALSGVDRDALVRAIDRCLEQIPRCT